MVGKAGKAEGGPKDRVGTVIKGKWTLHALLGVGGMATVYAASHRNGQRAALKILHADFAREKAITERFLREAYVSNKVQHHATCQVLDDDVTEQGEPFLIMELLEGETLRDAWKKSGRTMAIPRVLQITERILDCLAACHEIGVIHRDLKPANIFLTHAGEVKVLDFGVAQMRDATAERTATGTALGTPAYMSPEQAMGLVDNLDGRADLFSVGAMMHALITGHRINNGRTEQEALVMAATKPVPSIARIAPNLPIDIIQICDKSLAWDRRNRFDDARSMQSVVVESMALHGAPPLGPLPDGWTFPEPPRPSLSPAVAPSTPPAPVGRASRLNLEGFDPGAAQVGRQSQLKLDAFAPAAIAAKASASLEVSESDLRVSTARDLMKHLDRVLPSVRQFGWSHPATDRALRTAWEAFAAILGTTPDAAGYTVRPYSFLAFGHTVWEPGPPFDAVPYNLFAAGLRSLSITQGVLLEEFRELFQLFLLDPGRDLPPEDDLVAALWERALPHVKYETADAFAEGDAAEREAFYEEADAMEAMAAEAAKNHASRVEARAMAIATNRAALGQGRAPSLLAIERGAASALRAEIEGVTRDVWSDRYVDALVEGLIDVAQVGDAPLVLTSMRKSAADLAVAGRLDVIHQLHGALGERLTARLDHPEASSRMVSGLTNAMFGGETLELVLKRLKDEPGGIGQAMQILGLLSPNELPVVLKAIREGAPAEVARELGTWVERAMVGRESEVAQAALGADPHTSALLLGIVGRSPAPSAKSVLAALAQSEDIHVRTEVRMMLAPSPEQAVAELATLFEQSAPMVRMAALRAAVRFSVRGLWPAVSRAVGQKGFNDLGADERRELFRALVLLAPERGEPIALEVVKKGGVIMNEERETSRALAADALGEASRSRIVLQALQEVSASRWGISEEARNAAQNAARKISERLGLGGAPVS